MLILKNHQADRYFSKNDKMYELEIWNSVSNRCVIRRDLKNCFELKMQKVQNNRAQSAHICYTQCVCHTY